MKIFHIGDVLSITTGRLLSFSHIDGVYDILNYMTGDDITTAGIPSAIWECKPFILKKYPELEKVDTSDITPENWKKWVEKQGEKYGKTFLISAIPNHSKQNPIKVILDIKNKTK